MTAVIGRAWGWVASWGSYATTEDMKAGQSEGQKHAGSTDYCRKRTSWIRGWWRHQSDQGSSGEEYWEAQEKLQPMEIEDLGAGKQESEANSEQVSRWWKYLPSSYLSWPWKSKRSGPKQQKCDSQSGNVWKRDVDGEFDYYGTPPPSPTPSSHLTSPFRLFVDSLRVEIQPEHHEICFNFLRHLFDLFVVGFLWTVSPPTKLILEVLGVQGALRLWLHGMAMFFVSTVGMAGLLWLIQEYLPQFALIYGIIQALVISVSIRQSVILGADEENEEEHNGEEPDEVRGNKGHKEQLIKEHTQREKIKMS